MVEWWNRGGQHPLVVGWLWHREMLWMVSYGFATVFRVSPPSFDDNLMLRSGRFGRNVAHVPTFPLRCCLCHSGWLESVESETSFPNMIFSKDFAGSCWVYGWVIAIYIRFGWNNDMTGFGCRTFCSLCYLRCTRRVHWRLGPQGGQSFYIRQDASNSYTGIFWSNWEQTQNRCLKIKNASKAKSVLNWFGIELSSASARPSVSAPSGTDMVVSICLNMRRTFRIKWSNCRVSQATEMRSEIPVEARHADEMAPEMAGWHP